MLPPIDDVTLTSNPKFNALYSDLCSNKLNADGTSKHDSKAQRDRDAASKDLRKARVEAARKDLIKSGLQTLSYKPDELPEELQQLVAVIAALLDGQIAEDDKYLLQDDIEKFQDNIKPISTALLKQFQEDARALAVMIDPDNPPSPKDLLSALEEMKNTATISQTNLAAARQSLTTEALKLHELYRTVTETSIRVLEQTIHGSVARGTKAKADYMAVVAEGMDKKLKIQHEQLLSQSYSQEVQEALEARMRELQAESRSTTRKIREGEEQLERYKKTEGIESLAQEYADILKETEKVKADIAKLERTGG